MYKKQPTLTSIPERSENEEDMTTKWVPKKKHEVLKAKYKCLKKLFQIYDASVIGILPESCGTEGYLQEEIQNKRRKKRSHRTKTDASANTTEPSSDDLTQRSGDDAEKVNIATAVLKELNSKDQSSSSTQVDSTNEVKPSPRDNTTCTEEKDCEGTETARVPPPVPYLVFDEKRRLTRFQCFIHRILGIRHERDYQKYSMPNGHVYSASDNNILHNYNYSCSEKRRRRGLRFRRLRRTKKIQSDSSMRDVTSPVILTYVQSVKRNCLMDTSSRQCPIAGCRMVSYGIINFNDHMNLCHFPEKKFICHYCHESFAHDFDKLVHENEHIGICKLNQQLGTQSAPVSARPSAHKKASDTQTDPEVTTSQIPEDKLKKIVSFLEKMRIPEQNQILSELRMKGSDFNLEQCDDENGVESDSSDKQTMSCVNLSRKVEKKYTDVSEETSRRTISPQCSPTRLHSCYLCSESFNHRRLLSLHLELEHCINNDLPKLHSNHGILNTRSVNQVDMVSEDGKINVRSLDRSQAGDLSTLTSYTEISRRRSTESFTCDASTNLMYFSSLESIKNPSLNKMDNKIKNGVSSYKWEPGTKIIRV